MYDRMGDEVVVSVKLICDIAEGNPIDYPCGNRLFLMYTLDFLPPLDSYEPQLSKDISPMEFGTVVAEI